MGRIADEILMHYGTPRHSGRYPWGSGDNPYQHSGDFLSRVSELKKQGLSEKEIAEFMGMNTNQLRIQKTLARNEIRALNVDKAKSLRADGLNDSEIARQLGVNESTVRYWFNADAEARMNSAKQTAEFLKNQIDTKGMIDVGAGVERELNISSEKMKQALEILKQEGYEVYGGRVDQQTNPGKKTTLKIACPPGTEHKEIYDTSKIHSINDYTSHDDGVTFDTYQYPKSMDSNRIKIRYAEEGGVEKDGVVEIRRGVPDLDLGESRYAQVRILVDDTKYIKGMAVYSDDLPDGVDIVFNTNKSSSTPKMKVLKDITNDPDNPFGSLIKANGQSYYVDENGEKQLSLINKRAEEGDWGAWSKKLPSQFLAKQSRALIDKQLEITAAEKLAEYDEICSYTNPTVKKALLKSFADDCDAAAVHLKAAALPRQRYQVILPVPTLKDNEVYAPNYKNGEQVALVRFPHGGTFEIPILTVNNKHADARKMLGHDALDAVGINSKVAERLSGADFDGDTVMVIPTGGKVKIASQPELKGLKNFDPKTQYGAHEIVVDDDGVEHYYRNGKEYRKMNNTQTEMGKVSNLITDMTLKGADQDELARAVRHSMVVIDAEKHKLDYKQSEKDNGIAALKKAYQGRIDEDGTYHEGASTLISRAKAQQSIPKRQGTPKINPDTGELIYKTVDEPTYVNRDGKTITRTQKSTQMAETKDARTLSSGHPVEEAYATYANQMKSLANQARKEMVTTKDKAYSASANQTYKTEVSSLTSKLNVALKNAPRERQAQLMANTVVEAKKQSNPDMTKAEIKKEGQRALTAARATVGARRTPVEITPKEWEAIQAGAVSKTTLEKIVNNTDMDKLKQLASPRPSNTLSSSKANLVATLNQRGYTNAEIADRLDISTSTVQQYIK